MKDYRTEVCMLSHLKGCRRKLFMKECVVKTSIKNFLIELKV